MSQRFLAQVTSAPIGNDTRQYGLSARGLAIDTANGGVEEFPRFTSFWFERPLPNSRTLTLYALLDSISAAGAYRFEITPGVPQPWTWTPPSIRAKPSAGWASRR